jgi:hypothetical protein
MKPQPEIHRAAPSWCPHNFICAQLPELGLESERFERSGVRDRSLGLPRKIGVMGSPSTIDHKAVKTRE